MGPLVLTINCQLLIEHNYALGNTNAVPVTRSTYTGELQEIFLE